MRNRKSFICMVLSITLLALLNSGCKKDEDNNKVSDIDGNVYNTVSVGARVWLVESLKTTKFTDGTSIPVVTDNASWANLSTAATSDYNNTATNSAVYGKLYNWYAVAGSKKICPTGWHVPSDADWNDQMTALGGTSAAAGKMMEAGTLHWLSPNTSSTNSSGFTALGTGYRNYLGEFKDLKYFGGFWSSTSIDATFASYKGMYSGEASMDNHEVNKKTGLSVRCVKD